MSHTRKQRVQLAMGRWAAALRQPFVISVVVGFDNIQNHRITRISFHEAPGQHSMVFGPVPGPGATLCMLKCIMGQSDQSKSGSVQRCKVWYGSNIVKNLPDMECHFAFRMAKTRLTPGESMLKFWQCNQASLQIRFRDQQAFQYISLVQKTISHRRWSI